MLRVNEFVSFIRPKYSTVIEFVVMSIANQRTGEPVNGDNTAVAAAADQLDAEGSIVQSYERLKKSRGGFLAHLTRLYNEVEPLMADFENHQRVEDLSAAIEEQFEKFKAAHVACVTASADETETAVIVEGYNSQAANYTEYKQRVADWQRDRRDVATLHTAPAVDTDDHDAESIKSSAKSTTSSARARAATVKRRLMELKLKQALAEQEMEARRQEMERQQARANQEMEARRQELERQQVIQRQQNELDQAREEEQLWLEPVQNKVNAIPSQQHTERESYEHRLVQDDFAVAAAPAGQGRPAVGGSNLVHDGVIAGTASAGQGYPAVDSPPTEIGAGTVAQGNTRDRTIQSDDSSAGVASGVAWQGRSRGYPTHDPAQANQNNNNTTVSSTQNNGVVSDMTRMLRKGFSLPKPELFCFNGDSINFCKFMNNFELNIENEEPSNRHRLSYLIQYCTGEAKELIEDCVMLGDKGYARAKELLTDRYGQSHVVAQCYIGKLVNGPVIRNNDTKSLSRLGLEMSRAEITLTQLGFLEQINNLENIRRIVGRLPGYMKSKWVELAYSITKKGQSVKFTDLCKFVNERASLESSMFGLDFANALKQAPSQGKPGNSRGVHDKYSYNKGYQGTSLATAGSVPNKCRCCSGTCSKLAECAKFKGMRYRERRDYVRKNRLCDNCFIFKHYKVRTK